LDLLNQTPSISGAIGHLCRRGYDKKKGPSFWNQQNGSVLRSETKNNLQEIQGHESDLTILWFKDLTNKNPEKWIIQKTFRL